MHAAHCIISAFQMHAMQCDFFASQMHAMQDDFIAQVHSAIFLPQKWNTKVMIVKFLWHILNTNTQNYNDKEDKIR